MDGSTNAQTNVSARYQKAGGQWYSVPPNTQYNATQATLTLPKGINIVSIYIVCEGVANDFVLGMVHSDGNAWMQQDSRTTAGTSRLSVTYPLVSHGNNFTVYPRIWQGSTTSQDVFIEITSVLIGD